jgi:predicted nucleic acid-binding protein
LKARDLVDKSALAYPSIPITEKILSRAIDVQGELARSGRHLVPIPDLVIAATAEAAGLILLHYDQDFDRIAEITRQPTEWVVERGTL